MDDELKKDVVELWLHVHVPKSEDEALEIE